MEGDRVLIGQKKLVRETIIGNCFSSEVAPGPVGRQFIQVLSDFLLLE